MEDDKIKYSDIIQPDGSIEKLIGQLEEFTKQYSATVNAIRAGADRIVHGIRSASGATSEGRKSIDEAAEATSRLERAQRELRFAMSSTGKQVAWLKAQTVDTNRATVEQQRYIKMAISSYDKLKADLKQTVALYKSLTAAERADSEMGQLVLSSILALKSEIAKLDAEMKPHIQTLSALEKAKQKLAFVQSAEGKQLLDIQAQIRAEIAARSAQRESISAVEKAKLRLAQARSNENQEIKLYSLQTAEANRIAKLHAQIANSAEGSYNRLSAQYSLNKIRLNQMSSAERDATEAGKALVEETKQLYVRMRELQEETGNYRLSVGHYRRAFDGLGMSVSQVVRELPALAVSANTFFLAISNNIPLVVDEINKLNIKNAALKARGEETVSVTGSIVKSIISWQSALVVLLSILSISGGKIIEWFSNISNGSKKILTIKERLRALNNELKESAGQYGSNVVSFKKLQTEWSKLTNSDQKLKWIKDNKTEFENLGFAIDSVREADNAFIQNSKRVIAAMRSRAKATAATKLAEQKFEEAFRKREEAELENTVRNLGEIDREGNLILSEQTKERRAHLNELAKMQSAQISSSVTGNTGGSSAALYGAIESSISKTEALLDEAKAAEKNADAYFDMAAGYNLAADAELRAGNIKLQFKEKLGDDDGSGGNRDLTNAINRMALNARKKFEQSLTALERDEYEKRKQAATDAANVKIRELEESLRKSEDYLLDEKNKYRELTSEEVALVTKAQKEMRQTIINIQEQLSFDIEQIEIDSQISQLEVLRQTYELRAKAVQEGSEEELRLRLQAAQAAQQIALLENAKLPVLQRQDSTDIIAASFKSAQLLVGKQKLDTFDKQQAKEAAEFNVVRHSEREITLFKLGQEKERWEKLIDLAEQGGLDWSKEQIDAAKATIAGINREMGETSSIIGQIGREGLGPTLLERLGFDDSQIDALSEATNITVGFLQDIMAAEVQLAEQALETANARVEAAQNAYDAEVEARNNGYAHNVATAKKELEQEKKNQLAKQKQLELAKRRQEAVNSVIQASSLITASANLWASLSPIPIIGHTLALAAIATMWTSFAVAKIKAKQVTANSEEYGEGGLEFLQGGSHASGNDIDLHTVNRKGKNMRAEGGEALAIINKKNTSKYRKYLPDIIKSLNSGTFEDKYLNAFQAEGLNMQVSSVNLDLSTLEKDVKSIRRQNETKYYALSDGVVIIQHKNVKRIIKN